MINLTLEESRKRIQNAALELFKNRADEVLFEEIDDQARVKIDGMMLDALRYACLYIHNGFEPKDFPFATYITTKGLVFEFHQTI